MKLVNNGGTLKGDIKFTASGIETSAGRVGFGAVASVQVINSHTETQQGGWMGRTAAGALLLGPAGAIIGAATRKTASKTEIAFLITFVDGSSVFTKSSPKVFNEFYGLVQRGGDVNFRPAAFSSAGKFGSAKSNFIQVIGLFTFIAVLAAVFG